MNCEFDKYKQKKKKLIVRKRLVRRENATLSNHQTTPIFKRHRIIGCIRNKSWKSWNIIRGKIRMIFESKEKRHWNYLQLISSVFFFLFNFHKIFLIVCTAKRLCYSLSYNKIVRCREWGRQCSETEEAVRANGLGLRGRRERK